MDPQKAENSGQATDSKEDDSRAGHRSAATSTPPPAYDRMCQISVFYKYSTNQYYYSKL